MKKCHYYTEWLGRLTVKQPSTKCYDETGQRWLITRPRDTTRVFSSWLNNITRLVNNDTNQLDGMSGVISKGVWLHCYHKHGAQIEDVPLFTARSQFLGTV